MLVEHENDCGHGLEDKHWLLRRLHCAGLRTQLVSQTHTPQVCTPTDNGL